MSKVKIYLDMNHFIV